MNNPYLPAQQQEQFDDFLQQHILKDTLDCWRRTRLEGISASMAADGNISLPLIRAFDQVAKMVREKGVSDEPNKTSP